jgi:hypothetical protein
MSGYAGTSTVTPEIRSWGNGFMLAALAVGVVGVTAWFLIKGSGDAGDDEDALEAGGLRKATRGPDTTELSRTCQTIAARLNTFHDNLKNACDDLAMARASMTALHSGLDSNSKLQLPKSPANQPTDGGGKAKQELDDYRQQSLADFLAEQTKLLAMANGLGNEFDSVSERLDALKPAESLATFSAEIKALNSTTPREAPVEGLTDLVTTMKAAQKAAEDTGTVISGRAVTEEYVRRKTEFRSALDGLSKAWIQGFQQRDQDPETKKILEESFDRSREKFEKASKLFEQAKKRDAEVFATTTASVVQATPLPKYDMAGAFDTDLAARLVSPQVSDGDINIGVTAATQHVANKFGTEDPEGDIIFDLLLKDLDEFKNDIANVLPGRPGDEVLGPIAAAMQAKTLELNPHKMPSDQSSVTVGGKIYKKADEIGRGSYGEVRRYLTDDGKESIAIKHVYPIFGADGAHGEMAKDLRMHRQAMGSDGHSNMVRLHGAWLDDKGTLYSVQEDCAGGNVDQFAKGMQAAAECGIMSERGRNALVLDIFSGAAQGLKHVTNSGMNHGDLKGVNFFLSADGTAKIGDFGTAGIADEKGVGGEAGSPQFGPYSSRGEGETVSSQRRDVFMLGAMLDGLDGGIGWVLKDYGKYSRVTGHQETALDRLRNAMLDPDASQRPTIDAVMLASYLNEGLDNEEKDQPAPEPATQIGLKKAIIAYTKEVGGKISDPLDKIGVAKDKIKGSMAQFVNAETQLAEAEAKYVEAKEDKEAKKEDVEAKRKVVETKSKEVETKRNEYVKLLGAQQEEINKQQKRLNEINSDANVAKLVKEIKEASAAFGDAAGRRQR